MKFVYLLPVILWALFVDNSLSADSKPEEISTEGQYEKLDGTFVILTPEQENRLTNVTHQWQAIQDLERQHPRLKPSQPRYQLHEIIGYQRFCVSVFCRDTLDKMIQDMRPWPREYTISVIRDLIQVGVLNFTDLVYMPEGSTVANFTDLDFPLPVTNPVPRGPLFNAHQ